MVETGTNTGGAFTETVTGTDSPTQSQSGNPGAQTFTRTIALTGTYTRTDSGPGATLSSGPGTINFTLSEVANVLGAVFSQTQTGSDRYSLLEHFNNVANTESGNQPGNMDFFPYGQPFQDPVTIVGFLIGYFVGPAGWDSMIPLWGPSRNLGAAVRAGDNVAIVWNCFFLTLDILGLILLVTPAAPGGALALVGGGAARAGALARVLQWAGVGAIVLQAGAGGPGGPGQPQQNNNQGGQQGAGGGNAPAPNALANMGRPAWAHTPGGFVNWLRNLQRDARILTQEEADAIIAECDRLGVSVRLDPPHPNRPNWNVPHLNIGTANVHLQVPNGYTHPTVPRG
jgi:hypothetical protein